MQAKNEIFFRRIQFYVQFAEKCGNIYQKKQQSAERSGNNTGKCAGNAAQCAHNQFTCAQRHSAKRNIVNQPAEDFADDRIGPQCAVTRAQQKKEREHRAQQTVEHILNQQRRRAVPVYQQTNDAEHIVDHAQSKAKPKAQQKLPGLRGEARQIIHQRNTLPKNPPAVFGACS